LQQRYQALKISMMEKQSLTFLSTSLLYFNSITL
jgi:hypothetical protein